MIDVPISPDGRDVPGTATRGLFGLDEIPAQPVIFKCMGRSYSAVLVGTRILIRDVTDITRPLPLGTAEPADGGTWRVRTTGGALVRRTRDALDAVVSLRQAAWPPRDMR